MIDTTEALRAMRARGIDNGEDLLAYSTPASIMRSCQWWDKRKGVTPGLLAKKIREGGVAEDETPAFAASQKRRELEQRFAEYADRIPVGEAAESHRRLARRCWPEEPCECPGFMIVYDATYPVLATECDQCGFELGYTVRALSGLPARRERISA